MSEMMSGVRRLAGIEVVEHRAGRRVLAVLTFAVLTALSAWTEVHLPGNPVPVTLQSLMVVLSGALLGPTLGAASQVAYVAAGAMGLPVYSGGAGGFAWLFGPTGGYLLAFPLAAAAAGWIAGPARRGLVASLRLGAAMLVGHAVIFGGGVSWLAIVTGDVGRAIALGFVPFALGSVLKSAAGWLVAYRLRGRTLDRV